MDFHVVSEPEPQEKKKKPYIQKINHKGIYEALLSMTTIATKGLSKRNPGKAFLKFVKKAGDHKNFEKIIEQFVTYFKKVYNENKEQILEGEPDTWIKKIKFGTDVDKYLALGDIYNKSDDDKKDELFFLMYEIFCNMGLSEEEFRKVEAIRAEEFEEDDEPSQKPKGKSKEKKNPLADLMGTIFKSIEGAVDKDKPVEEQFTGDRIGKVVAEVFNSKETLQSVQDFGKSLAGSELGGMLRGLEAGPIMQQSSGSSPLDLLSQPLEQSARKPETRDEKKSTPSQRSKKGKEKEKDDGD